MFFITVIAAFFFIQGNNHLLLLASPNGSSKASPNQKTNPKSSSSPTNHGWEVKRNNEHKQPEIPKAAKEMLQKYNAYYTGDPDKKTIYLTIDLGYESGNTNAILDVLKANNVKATFFIIKDYFEKNPEIVDRIVKEGHSLQNHTANYLKLHTLSEAKIRKEIMDMHDRIKNRYNIHMKYLRTPYEEWSDPVMKTVKDTGYKTIFWSIACVDWVKEAEAGYIYNSILNNHHNGGIILMHAVSPQSPWAVYMAIKKLQENGYQLKTLDM
ncbi:peptidoglycan-N-acetylmuramic acid deacetylase PdaA precursor [Oxobacter pfennigii]|uniref:Peptidoglycan-N-acetylmuramic acid deacetylase PdaA n=2 Tax=Oxobacter pfennigii TaxID=36849 RepID=A0A0P8YZ71_9CLOT|nr:peptidoglycan-N-acetylmuramic acid deacetylase PdaA precursor [Oxobacter pfennigii]